MGVLRLFPAWAPPLSFAVELLRLRARNGGKHIAFSRQVEFANADL
jgi:hypothetical protein